MVTSGRTVLRLFDCRKDTVNRGRQGIAGEVQGRGESNLDMDRSWGDLEVEIKKGNVAYK